MNQREQFETEYPVPDREAFSEPLGMYVWKDYPNTVSPHNDLYDAFRDGWDAAMQHAPQPAVPEGYQIQKQGNVIVIDHTDEQKGGVAIFKSEKTVRMQFLHQYFADLLSAAKVSAPRHQWDESGERCVKCGDKDWFASVVCDESKLLSAGKGRAS